VGFGENRIGGLIDQYPEKKPEIEKMQAEMSYHMLATFSDAFSYTAENVDEGRKAAAEALASRGEDQETVVWHGADLTAADAQSMEAVLADTVLGEFKDRLGRIGLDYQTPTVPAA
jgi:hypothetical protein